MLKRADIKTDTVTKATMVTELSGIRMADTTGERFPVVAKLNPTTLYRNDSVILR